MYYIIEHIDDKETRKVIVESKEQDLSEVLDKYCKEYYHIPNNFTSLSICKAESPLLV